MTCSENSSHIMVQIPLQYSIIKQDSMLHASLIDIALCDRACENRPCEHKKSPIFSVLAVAEFNELSSAAYRNGILHSEWKILAKI